MKVLKSKPVTSVSAWPGVISPGLRKQSLCWSDGVPYGNVHALSEASMRLAIVTPRPPAVGMYTSYVGVSQSPVGKLVIHCWLPVACWFQTPGEPLSSVYGQGNQLKPCPPPVSMSTAALTNPGGWTSSRLESYAYLIALSALSPLSLISRRGARKPWIVVEP